MNESDYWEEVELLSTEIEDAISVFYTYEQMNRLAVEDQRILRILNKEPLFWNVQTYSLQTSLLIVLGRIFDTSNDSHSIHKVINATVGNMEFFSRQALGKRKIKANGGTKPYWLDGFLANAWEPTAPKELRHLKTSLREHQKRFEEAYRPIRNKVFAHKGISDPKAVFGLFEKTSREEIGLILDFLRDLIEAIQNLYLNGTKPELDQQSRDEANQHIRESTIEVLRRLAKGYA